MPTLTEKKYPGENRYPPTKNYQRARWIFIFRTLKKGWLLFVKSWTRTPLSIQWNQNGLYVECKMGRGCKWARVNSCAWHNWGRELGREIILWKGGSGSSSCTNYFTRRLCMPLMRLYIRPGLSGLNRNFNARMSSVGPPQDYDYKSRRHRRRMIRSRCSTCQLFHFHGRF